MIPLGGDQFPTTAADLADALRSALRDVVRLPDERAAAAKEKGVDVERIDLTLTQLGPRSVRLAAKAAVQTKALFKTIRGAVNFAGRLDIDDRLVATLSELAVAGEGTMIALAVNLFRG